MTYFRKDIQAMASYVPGEQPRSGKVIKLNTNENPYPCSPKVIQAIHTACERGLERYPDASGTAFRMRAADLLGVEADWILCGNGSDDILTIVTRALVGEGELIRYPTPSYILYRTLAEIQGARFESVPFESDWSLGARFVEPAPGLRLAYLPNPNSPSGTMIRPEQIATLADALPCPLLVDEAYADFSETNCVSLVEQNEKIMVSRTLSKSYALAGLRFGFLVAQPHLIEQFNKVRDSYNCDSLSIAGACAAIDDQAWLADNRSRIVATRARLADETQKLGFLPPDSDANFVWNPHPETDVRPIYEQLKAAGVLVRYMDYGPTAGDSSGKRIDGLRISVGTDSQIDACLGLLQKFV